jgi:ParE toxin of type II toxin-antitoxin system, parDE
MKIVFSKLAKLELDDAIRFYEMEFDGLGRRFRDEVKKAVVRISEYPTAWSIEKGEVRKWLHKFPCKVLYSNENDHIFIIAIAHQHRRPDYWTDRQT